MLKIRDEKHFDDLFDRGLARNGFSELKADVAVLKHVVMGHEKTLGRHSAILDRHSAILEKHSAILEKHSAILEKHSAILEKHSAILDEHTRLHKQHAIQLEELSTNVKIILEGVHLLLAERRENNEIIRSFNDWKDNLGATQNVVKVHIADKTVHLDPDKA